MSWRGLDALRDVREWSGSTPGYPGVVEMPSRMSVSGREALPGVREWSGVPPECPAVVGRPSQMSGWQCSGSVSGPLECHLTSTSVNFMRGWETLHQLLLNFRAASRHSVNLFQHSILPGDILSPSVNFPFHRETFRKFSLRPGKLPSTFVKFPCSQKTFH